MKKEIIILALISTLFTGCAYAAPSVAEEDFEEMFGTIKEKVQPRPIDNKAAKLAKEFAQKNNGPDPTLGRGGAVVYTFGTTMPRILCRPMRVTDIELEPGETVTTPPFVGDSVNWQILPASSGSGANLTMHVMVKPSMPDLATNLIIHTSRRSYHLDLVSSKTQYTPHVAFTYPQQGISQDVWDAFLSGIETQKAADKANQPYVLPHEAKAKNAKTSRIDNTVRPDKPAMPALDYGYRIIPKGKNIKWLPDAVYTDGAKTYIQFPQNLKNLEAPVFMAVRNGQRELVNYRIVGNTTYVIDAIIEKGILLSGSGAYSAKVTIVKDKEETSEKATPVSKPEQKRPTSARRYEGPEPSPSASTNDTVEKKQQKQLAQPKTKPAEAAREKPKKTVDKSELGPQRLGFPFNTIYSVMQGIDRTMQQGREQNQPGKKSPMEEKKQYTYEDYLKERKAKKLEQEIQQDEVVSADKSETANTVGGK
ncbi:P-type conjugative transfer protein TrbG [uncultured Cloacibacillus sp.]|uniref:P-type conjugative transfer protein TrbG n=1 Tax=uncultured Cloacibacillus sp. TaxID=889794 RepID=UPI0026DB8DD6|nr:P-type conjugative transfer protein TrbG [uncultured Cloacibacillus sp.]